MNYRLVLDRQEILARIRGDRRPYEIRNATAEKATMRLYDEIGLFGITAEEIGAALADVTAPELEVQISSPGGDVFSGIAIYNALRAHPARIVTRVDGMAASIASVIVQAGDRRIMLSGSQMMVHEAWGIGIGTSGDLRELADILDKQTDVIAGIYHERSGRSKSLIRSLLKAETWMTADEAVKQGFADELVKPKGAENQVSPEEESVLARAEHHVWRAEVEAIASKLAVTEARDRFSELLTADPRAEVGYVEVTPSLVEEKRKGLAAGTATAVARDLGIDPPTIRWFRSAMKSETPNFHSTPINGKAEKAGEIWVNTALNGSSVVAVVAHELAHLAGKDELDAQLYEKQWRSQ